MEYFDRAKGQSSSSGQPSSMQPLRPHLKLAKAYIPIQQYGRLYQPKEGLYKGTIFQDLYRPYVRR